MRASVAKAEAIRDIAAYSVTAGLLFGDTVAMRECVVGVARNRDVQAIVLKDGAGGVVAAYPGPQPSLAISHGNGEGFATPDRGTYVTSTVIRRSKVRLGSLTVYLSLAELRAEVANAPKLGLFIGALIFAIGFIVVFVVSTLVTRPLADVAETVKKIAAGDLELRAAETSDAQVTQLVRAFNGMVDNFVGAQADLALSNQQLEARVEARTAELRTSSETLQSLIDVAPKPSWPSISSGASLAGTRPPRSCSVGAPPRCSAGRCHSSARTRRMHFGNIGQNIVKNGGVYIDEQIRLRRDGSRVDVLLASGTLVDEAQRAIGYIGVITDLSERKLLEEQFRQSQKMEAIGNSPAASRTTSTTSSRSSRRTRESARGRRDR